jgi:hypothetical protein
VSWLVVLVVGGTLDGVWFLFVVMLGCGGGLRGGVVSVSGGKKVVLGVGA